VLPHPRTAAFEATSERAGLTAVRTRSWLRHRLDRVVPGTSDIASRCGDALFTTALAILCGVATGLAGCAARDTSLEARCREVTPDMSRAEAERRLGATFAGASGDLYYVFADDAPCHCVVVLGAERVVSARYRCAPSDVR